MRTAIIRLTKTVTYGAWSYPGGSTLRAYRDAEGMYLFLDSVGTARRLHPDEFEVVT